MVDARVSMNDLISSEFETVSNDAPISKLLAALKKTEGLPAIVMDGGDYKGLASVSSLLRNVDISKTKVSSILRTAPTLVPSHSVDDAVRLMRDADVRVLPVLENNKVTGVVPIRALLKVLSKSPIFKDVKAKDLAEKNSISISVDDDIGKAIKVMKEKHIKKLVVMDAKRNVLGIVKLEELAGDLLLKMGRHNRTSYRMGRGGQSIPDASPMTISVKSVMDESPVIVSQYESARNVLTALSQQNNPVVLVQGNGIISSHDVLDFYLSHTPQETSRVSISHLPDIDEIDRAFIEETLQRTFSRFERTLKSDHRMSVVFKQSNKAGLRAQTTVKISIHGAGKPFHAEASDWKVRLATKEACKAIENELSKGYRSPRPR